MKNQILIRSHCQIANILLTGLPLCSGEVFFMEKEIWKPVKNYEGFYEVSNIGRIKSLINDKTRKEKILKQNIACGYLKVNLYFNGVKKCRSVHQLVAEAFLNHKPNGHKLVVNHINFIRTDNRVSNLRWVTKT